MDKKKTKWIGLALMVVGGLLLIGGRMLWSGTYHIGSPPLEMVLVGYGGIGALVVGAILFIVSLCLKDEYKGESEPPIPLPHTNAPATYYDHRTGQHRPTGQGKLVGRTKSGSRN